MASLVVDNTNVFVVPPTPTKENDDMTEPLKSGDVAAAIGTTARELRIFLRASTDYEACGAGARYAFAKKDLPTLKKRFTAWEKSREADRKAKREAAMAAAKAKDDAVEELPEAEEEIEELPEEEPTPKPRRRTRKPAPVEDDAE